MSKPFDCEHTCKYCVAEGCEERRDEIHSYSMPCQPGELKSWTEKQTIHCEHMLQWVNQGITGCRIGLDPSKCDECPSRSPKEILVEYSSCSTLK